VAASHSCAGEAAARIDAGHVLEKGKAAGHSLPARRRREPVSHRHRHDGSYDGSRLTDNGPTRSDR
jgi:hypothetical protein